MKRNIESIVKDMTSAAKIFYRRSENINNTNECLKHYNYLKELLRQVDEIKNRTERVLEIEKILVDAAIFFNKHIVSLKRKRKNK